MLLLVIIVCIVTEPCGRMSLALAPSFIDHEGSWVRAPFSPLEILKLEARRQVKSSQVKTPPRSR